MKNTLMQKLNTLKPLFIAFILLAGFVAVSAIKWETPLNDPSKDHAGPPILEGGNTQEKTGQLTFASLTNIAHGPVVSYSPLYVGIYDDKKTPTDKSDDIDIVASSKFFGKLNLFNIVDPTATTDLPLCTDTNGKVKTCSQGVLFEHVLPAYYTDTNVLTYPSGSSKVKGYVKYEIDPSVTCNALPASGTLNKTDWGNNTSLTGSNNSYAVTFDDWGSYALQISCTNGKTYTANIDIKGKLIPTVYSQVQTFQFPTARTLQIKAQASGSEAGGLNGNTCYGGADGLPSFVHVSSSSSWTPNSTSSNNKGATYQSGANIIHAGGGTSPINSGGSCYGHGGTFVQAGSSTTGVTTKYGYNSYGSSGGAGGSGIAIGYDGGNTYDSNTYGGGGYGNRGGGGGSYVSASYTIAANNYIYLYQAGGVGSGGSAGKKGFVTVEWK